MTSGESSTVSPTDDGRNRRLVFGAALAVHALMVAAALGAALVFSLFVRLLPAPESPT